MSSLPYEDVLELNRQFIRYWVIDTQVLTHMEAKEILESMKEMTEEETARAGYDFCIESGWPPQEAYKLWYGEAVQQLKSDQEVRRQEHPTDAENTTEIDAPVDGAAQLHQHGAAAARSANNASSRAAEGAASPADTTAPIW